MDTMSATVESYPSVNYRPKGALYVATLLSMLALYVSLHMIASLNLPVPWTDEAHFLWQSVAFQEHNTLLAPELNPDRILYGQPPVFMIFYGFLFKLVGFSLSIARHISLVLVILTFFLLALIWRQLEHPYLLLLLSGLFLLNRYFIVLGNVARPEAFLLLLIVLSMLFLSRGREMEGLAILLISPLVHPNGIYFLIAVLLYLILNKTWNWNAVKCSKTDIALLSIVGFLWIGYLGFVGVGWDGFVTDMQYQFNRKLQRDIGQAFVSWVKVTFLICLISALVISIRRKLKPLSLLLTFSLASWLVNRIGQEMWYGVFDSFAFLLLSISVFELVLTFLPKMSAKGLVAGVIFLLVVSLDYTGGMIERISAYPSNIVWSGMQMPDTIPYLTSDDIDEINNLVLSHSSTRTQFRVEFEPGGDGLLYHGLRKKNIQIYYAHKATHIIPDRTPDLYIIHESKYLPPWWREYPLNWAFKRAGIEKDNPAFVLRRRQTSEVWYYRFTNTTNLAYSSSDEETDRR